MNSWPTNRFLPMLPKSLSILSETASLLFTMHHLMLVLLMRNLKDWVGNGVELKITARLSIPCLWPGKCIPVKKNSLDALCKRYEIDNSQRDLHGALLDAQILLDVYLAMTGGQTDLLLHDDQAGNNQNSAEVRKLDPNRPRLRVIEPTGEELEAHYNKLDTVDKESNGNCIWKKLEEIS